MVSGCGTEPTQKPEMDNRFPRSTWWMSSVEIKFSRFAPLSHSPIRLEDCYGQSSVSFSPSIPSLVNMSDDEQHEHRIESVSHFFFGVNPSRFQGSDDLESLG